MKKLPFLILLTLPLLADLDFPYAEEDVPPAKEIPPVVVDMQKMQQPFVLETKKIEIPRYSDAFNPSIIRWNDQLLMVFRYRAPNTDDTNPMAFVWMDKDFNLLTEPMPFDIPFDNPYLSSRRQDPRLVAVGERLFMVYSNFVQGPIKREIRRVYVAELDIDGKNVSVKHHEPLLHFEGETEMRWEKNWTPFEYDGELLLSYSLDPHRILHPVFNTCSCEMISSSNASIQWDWGPLRGGTPALRINDQYLAFFHSAKNIISVQSNGKSMTHYVTGCYTFSCKPPFEITAMSPEPIVGQDFYLSMNKARWKPLRVVFPCGFIFDDEHIFVSYGRQDNEIWIAKLDKAALLESLVPVK